MQIANNSFDLLPIANGIDHKMHYHSLTSNVLLNIIDILLEKILSGMLSLRNVLHEDFFGVM